MTMAALLAIGAPRLRDGDFYRVRSTADGFVLVEIREEAPPSWRNAWRKSRRISEALAPRTDDPAADVRVGCERALDAISARNLRRDYWDGIAALTGDHR